MLYWMLWACAHQAPVIQEPTSMQPLTCHEVVTSLAVLMTEDVDDAQLRQVAGHIVQTITERCSDDDVVRFEVQSRCLVNARSKLAFQECPDAGPDSDFGLWLRSLMPGITRVEGP